MLILIRGNFVQGFTAYDLPEAQTTDEETTILDFYRTHVPECRIIERREAAQLIEEFGSWVQPEVVIGAGLDDMADGKTHEEVEETTSEESDGAESGGVSGEAGGAEEGTGDGSTKHPADV